MAAIMESLKKLSLKLGVTDEADTIVEQINLLCDKVGADHGRDIADALDKYAEAREEDTPEEDEEVTP